MNVKQEEEPLTGLGRGGTWRLQARCLRAGARPGAGITPIWQVGNRRPGMLAGGGLLAAPAPPSPAQQDAAFLLPLR